MSPMLPRIDTAHKPSQTAAAASSAVLLPKLNLARGSRLVLEHHQTAGHESDERTAQTERAHPTSGLNADPTSPAGSNLSQPRLPLTERNWATNSLGDEGTVLHGEAGDAARVVEVEMDPQALLEHVMNMRKSLATLKATENIPNTNTRPDSPEIVAESTEIVMAKTRTITNSLLSTLAAGREEIKKCSDEFLDNAIFQFHHRHNSEIKDWKRLLIKVRDVTLLTDGTAAFHKRCGKCLREMLRLKILYQYKERDFVEMKLACQSCGGQLMTSGRIFCTTQKKGGHRDAAELRGRNEEEKRRLLSRQGISEESTPQDPSSPAHTEPREANILQVESQEEDAADATADDQARSPVLIMATHDAAARSEDEESDDDNYVMEQFLAAQKKLNEMMAQVRRARQKEEAAKQAQRRVEAAAMENLHSAFSEEELQALKEEDSESYTKLMRLRDELRNQEEACRRRAELYRGTTPRATSRNVLSADGTKGAVNEPLRSPVAAAESPRRRPRPTKPVVDEDAKKKDNVEPQPDVPAESTQGATRATDDEEESTALIQDSSALHAAEEQPEVEICSNVVEPAESVSDVVEPAEQTQTASLLDGATLDIPNRELGNTEAQTGTPRAEQSHEAMIAHEQEDNAVVRNAEVEPLHHDGVELDEAEVEQESLAENSEEDKDSSGPGSSATHRTTLGADDTGNEQDQKEPGPEPDASADDAESREAEWQRQLADHSSLLVDTSLDESSMPEPPSPREEGHILNDCVIESPQAKEGGSEPSLSDAVAEEAAGGSPQTHPAAPPNGRRASLIASNAKAAGAPRVGPFAESSSGARTFANTAFRGKRHSINVGVPTDGLPADFNLAGLQVQDKGGRRGSLVQAIRQPTNPVVPAARHNHRRSSLLEGLWAQEHARQRRGSVYKFQRTPSGGSEAPEGDQTAEPEGDVGIAPRPYISAPGGPIVATVDQILKAPLRKMSSADDPDVLALVAQSVVESELRSTAGPVTIVRASLQQPPTADDVARTASGETEASTTADNGSEQAAVVGSAMASMQAMRQAFRAQLQAISAANAPQQQQPTTKSQDDAETIDATASKWKLAGDAAASKSVGWAAATGMIQSKAPHPPTAPRTKDRPGILQRATSLTRKGSAGPASEPPTDGGARWKGARKKMGGVRKMVRIVSEVEKAFDMLSKPIECKYDF